MSQHRTPHQEKIIRRYYDNREAIGLQKAQEVITELYLCEGAKKRKQLWDRLASHLEKIGMKDAQIQKLREADDAAAVATAIQKYA